MSIVNQVSAGAKQIVARKAIKPSSSFIAAWAVEKIVISIKMSRFFFDWYRICPLRKLDQKVYAWSL